MTETNTRLLKEGLKLSQVSLSSSSFPEHTNATGNNINGSVDEINLSIDETNVLRTKLGLSPLRITSIDAKPSGRKASEAIHAPASNTREQDDVKNRIEEAKLKRQVETNISNMERALNSTTSSTGGTIDWVQKMREARKSKDCDKKESKQSKAKLIISESTKMKDYTKNDFKDQNLTVTHSSNEFEVGTTILTLADTTILGTEEGEDENALENVNMSENATAIGNLKRKRMIERGVGHAGGYAGYDDDEFEEVGGVEFSLGKDKVLKANIDDSVNKKKGFKLGDSILNDSEDKFEGKSKLFDSFNGKSVSLVSSKQTSRQADFMTYEEEESMDTSFTNKEVIEKRRRKKEKKLLKKLKKEGKVEEKDKDKEHHAESREQSLLDELEVNAPNANRKSSHQRKRKRRVANDDTDDDTEETTSHPSKNGLNHNQMEIPKNDEIVQQDRKEKFDRIMEKGNTRTECIFKEVNKHSEPNRMKEEFEKDDDEFLSAAISKARRLRRLRNLNAKVCGKEMPLDNHTTPHTARVTGADAVVQSICSMKHEFSNHIEGKNNYTSTSRITFELDATKEFTRILQSQQTQKNKEIVETVKEPHKDIASYTPISSTNANANSLCKPENEPNRTEQDRPVSLEELADEVKEDYNDTRGGFGDTASTKPVGRGLSNFLSMLKHTGDITGKNAGKEELRGRAKDERNYEDYEKLNLKEVVKLDPSRVKGSIHEKDLEFVNREIKLEYRDDHGRLLTRKEAYRNLCYQFHGHGSSKKNEEKRLKQIERERTEGSLASGQGDNSGTLGALKATQRATGKAFVLHKT